MRFGEYIKLKRKKKGLSVREAAKRCDISHPYWSQLENGKTKNPNPTKKTVLKIVNGLQLDEVLTLYRAGYISADEIKEINKKLKLNRSNLDAAANFLYNQATDNKNEDDLISIIQFKEPLYIRGKKLSKEDRSKIIGDLIDEFVYKKED